MRRETERLREKRYILTPSQVIIIIMIRERAPGDKKHIDEAGREEKMPYCMVYAYVRTVWPYVTQYVYVLYAHGSRKLLRACIFRRKSQSCSTRRGVMRAPPSHAPFIC